MPVGQNFELQSTWGSHPRASAGEYGVWTSPGAQKKSRMAGETKRTMVWGRMTGRGWGGGAAGSGSGGGRGRAARVGRGALMVGCRGGGYWPCECSVLVAGRVQAEKSARMLGTFRVARIGVRVARQVEINSVPAFLRERFLR
ncbi:hypothetical protein C8J57DRAFT_1230099 [Mycena rebaudengoi]|nr:hypothetical protein C8J57DRAFT_1230099 [Mycena rebaudengoi]